MKIYMTVSNTDETPRQLASLDRNERLLTPFEKLHLFIKVMREKRIIAEITQVVSVISTIIIWYNVFANLFYVTKHRQAEYISSGSYIRLLKLNLAIIQVIKNAVKLAIYSLRAL